MSLELKRPIVELLLHMAPFLFGLEYDAKFLWDSFLTYKIEILNPISQE